MLLLNFQEEKNGRGSEYQTTFPVFWNPLRSDRAVGFTVGCAVIQTQEIHVFLCPVEVTCATGSSDGNATFTPTPLCLWHVGVPEEGRPLFLPLPSLRTAELVPMQQVKLWNSFPKNLCSGPRCRLAFPSSVAGSRALQILLKSQEMLQDASSVLNNRAFKCLLNQKGKDASICSFCPSIPQTGWATDRAQTSPEGILTC